MKNGWKNVVLLSLVVPTISWAALPTLNPDAVTALGETKGSLTGRGFVFINGGYLRPPYQIARKGNVITINTHPVEEPVAWAKFTALQSGNGEEGEADAGDGADATAVETLADLFAEEKPATDNSVVINPLFKPFLDQIDRRRAALEASLRANEFNFFGVNYLRVNGDFSVMRKLLDVLPEALETSSSADALFVTLRENNIMFLDNAVCQDLYRNRVAVAPNLKRRRAQVNEQLRNARRSR